MTQSLKNRQAFYAKAILRYKKNLTNNASFQNRRERMISICKNQIKER